MLHQRLGSTTRTTARSGRGLAAALLAATTALSACGAVTLGGSDSSANDPVAAPSATSPSQAPAPAPSKSEPPKPTKPTGSTTAPATEAAQPSPTTSDATTPATNLPTTKPKPTTPKPTTPKPTTPKPTTPEPETVPTEGDTLHVGDSGPYVRSVQQRLSSLGYWNGTPDGEFGMLTAQAVMALQKAAGLGRDGVYGPSTRKALQAGTIPRARIGGTGIEVDKARQLLLVVRGGRVATILNTSTGSGETYTSNGSQHIANTPAGSFSTFRSVDHLDKGPLGDLWRPRYFNGGIAVHGAASIPGYPASHGCARVSNPAMNMIWANGLMPIGGRVVVY